MNSAIIALILVTSTGTQHVAMFDSMETCEQARKNITHHDSFCHQTKQINIEEHMDMMFELVDKMKQKMDQQKQKNNV